MTKRQEFGSKWLWSISRSETEFNWRDWEKPRERSVRIAEIPAQIQTWYFPNTNAERYHWKNLQLRCCVGRCGYECWCIKWRSLSVRKLLMNCGQSVYVYVCVCVRREAVVCWAKLSLGVSLALLSSQTWVLKKFRESLLESRCRETTCMGVVLIRKQKEWRDKMSPEWNWWGSRI